MKYSEKVYRIVSSLFSVLARDPSRRRGGLPAVEHLRHAVPNSSSNLLSSTFGLLPHHIPDQEIPHPEPVHWNNVRLDLLLRHRLRWWFDRMVRGVKRGPDHFHRLPLRDRAVRHWCGVIDALPKQRQCLGLRGRYGASGLLGEQCEKCFDLPYPFVSQSRSEVGSRHLDPTAHTACPHR